MNIGVIGIRGAWSTEALSAQLRRKDAGGAVLELDEIAHDLDAMRFYHPDHDLQEFDAFIVKKIGRTYSPHLLDQLSMLEVMARQGVRFFSPPTNIRRMTSRLSCTITLRENGIPMPLTWITSAVEDAVQWVADHGPAVVKPLYSTKARGMALVATADETRAAVSALLAGGEKLIYLQQQVDLGDRDYGLVFLGGEYIGAYARVAAAGTWHTSTGAGGHYEPFTPTEDQIALASRAQAPFGLDFTCVDIADTPDAGPVVFEVSAFGGYRGLYQATGLDASDLVTDYAIDKLRLH